ncbi:uncharacterized protein LOC123003538 [Tribolium madens]|uniref:uncharacterized protein LOC123003538 n=1 Tax=Tribolium madens TaxID=41895 RepID=UPI001CF7400F|nr:uncharacterized protein LOC123003538 [Tribolium madens]
MKVIFLLTFVVPKMKVIFLLTFVIFVVHSQYCEPKDEFLNKNSSEWDLFMEKLDEVTFKTNYTAFCKINTHKEVVVNASSPILWELRFDIYNKRQQEENKTIEQCYSENKGETTCDIQGFQECMKNARKAMLQDLNSEWWKSEIQKKLEEEAELC